MFVMNQGRLLVSSKWTLTSRLSITSSSSEYAS